MLSLDFLLLKREVLFVFFVFSYFSYAIRACKRMRYLSVEANIVCLVYRSYLVWRQNRTVVPISLLLVTTLDILKLGLRDLVSECDCWKHCVHIGEIGGSD
jgi:hypothetical protein